MFWSWIKEIIENEFHIKFNIMFQNYVKIKCIITYIKHIFIYFCYTLNLYPNGIFELMMYIYNLSSSPVPKNIYTVYIYIAMNLDGMAMHVAMHC